MIERGEYMHEEKCPGCNKELSLTPGNYPVASFYGPALCTCQGTLQTFPEIANALKTNTVEFKMKAIESEALEPLLA